MKYLFLFLTCLVLISCSHKRKTKNELETLHYNGRVKTVTYKIYKAKSDSGMTKKGSLLSKVVTQCDSAGYFVKQSNYKPGDKLVYQVVRRYDAKNNLINEEKVEDAMEYLVPGNTKPDSLAITRDSFALKFDAHGNKTEVKASENSKPWYRDVNIFDSKGNVIEQKEYIPWDTLNKKETYRYDENGNMIEKAAYRPDSSLYLKYTYKYDDKANITEVVAYQNDGNISTKEIMKYDEKGNKVADSCNKADGTPVYDWRYEFTAFDSEGNWINEVTYAGGKPQTMVERTIEYYK